MVQLCRWPLDSADSDSAQSQYLLLGFIIVILKKSSRERKSLKLVREIIMKIYFFYPKLKKFHGLDCPKIERRMTLNLQRPKRNDQHCLIGKTHIYFLKVLRARHRLNRVDIIEGHGQFLAVNDRSG